MFELASNSLLFLDERMVELLQQLIKRLRDRGERHLVFTYIITKKKHLKGSNKKCFYGRTPF
jgi:hypothetical protein